MRQAVNALLVLVVVAAMAAFVVSSIVTVIHATEVLQQSVVEVDDLTFAERLGECDELDPFPCL